MHNWIAWIERSRKYIQVGYAKIKAYKEIRPKSSAKAESFTLRFVLCWELLDFGKGMVINMENYIYKCPVCGYQHQVPQYWMSFSPDETMEYPHMRMDTGSMCDNLELNYVGEQST